MQVNFQAYGQGPPFIILHGLFGSSDNWQSVGRRLGEQFHVFALDQRNHGRSPHSSEMNFQVMAEDVREFVQQEKLERAHLMGHSMGGKTAMMFALIFPEHVDKLIIVDIAPRAYSPDHAEILKALLSIDFTQFRERGSIEKALEPKIPEKVVRQFLLKNLERVQEGGFRWRMNLKAIAAKYDQLSAALPTGRVFDKPALFIRGERSEHVREADWAMIVQLFPDARLQTVPGAGHWVHTDAPEAFLEVVQDFISTG
jgi:pimeloyl-ACP methyl ester carboxylesterase